MAPRRLAPIIFSAMPPIGPTLPSSLISPVPAMCRPPVSDPGVSLSTIPSANIRPALGPPTSCREMATFTGDVVPVMGVMPMTARTGVSVELPVVRTALPRTPLRR